MPVPVGSDQKYLPGLDGLRAIAVAAVVAYHLGYGWAQGGLLGVSVFFTLSGYLITDILVGQWAARGRIGLASFWLRRARRLLPGPYVRNCHQHPMQDGCGHLDRARAVEIFKLVAARCSPPWVCCAADIAKVPLITAR